MKDPVCCSDSYTYERSSIENWFKKSNRSPMTGEVLISKLVYPNKNLKEEMEMYENEISWYYKTRISSLNDQPTGVILMVFKYLDINSIVACSQVNKKWRKICFNNYDMESYIENAKRLHRSNKSQSGILGLFKN